MGTEQSEEPPLAALLATLRAAKQNETDDERELVVVTDWKVKSDGRLTIPSDKREKYGIEEGDDVDGLLLVPGE